MGVCGCVGVCVCVCVAWHSMTRVVCTYVCAFVLVCLILTVIPSPLRPQYNTLVKQFRDTMYEYNTLTEEYRAKSKDRIRRQLELGE